MTHQTFHTNPTPQTGRAMNIVLTRTLIRGEFCEGYLTIDGSARICHTLENSDSRVPAGEYIITLAKCKQYSRKMPLLNPKAPCDLCPKLKFVCNNTHLPCYCPMLKPGNGVCGRLDGSILVGQRNCLGSLIHPKTTFDPLYERIRKSVSRGHEVRLTIKDPPDLSGSLSSSISSKGTLQTPQTLQTPAIAATPQTSQTFQTFQTRYYV